MTRTIFIVGAGPAGLTAGVEAIRKGLKVELVEVSDKIGGISKTVEVDGWRFDLGGHRFFTKVERVESFWRSILSPDDFLKRPRQSRIFYKGKFFDYPLKPLNALLGLGLIETVRCIGSFLMAQVKKSHDESNFEGWVSKRFGWRLYSIFFKTYTEKVWGIPASSLSAAWAAQRIKNLSLFKAVINAFGINSKGSEVITTLIDTFEYPRLGPGMMWEAAAQEISSHGGLIHFEEYPLEISRNEDRLKIRTNKRIAYADTVISSMPLSELPTILKCENKSVIESARRLKYRDFLTVGLVVEGEELFSDNWIYIHSPSVRVGRIQNFRSWSPELVKPGFTFLGLEYFVNQGDEIWESEDEELVQLAKEEIVSLGLANSKNLHHGYVVRVPKAYPVYDEDYGKAVRSIANWLESDWPEVIAVGRNGMHRYNNQDHSMLTAMVAIDNLFSKDKHDLWEINVDNEYHETKSNHENLGGRSTPLFPRVE